VASRRRRRRKATGVEQDIGIFASRKVGQLTFRIWQALTFANPVDTGYSRAGWTPVVGRQRPAIRGDRPDRAAARARAAAVLSQNQARANRIASRYRLRQGIVYITNAVSYVRFLNMGTSAQAPAMFVEQAVRAGIAAARRDQA
jgi:hypothetical protein